ncbi:MAG: hypothetical protein KJO00_03825 [Bacteroidia bacterium]|nr:hypothetical protein [Bacteroidia bacterium]
MKTLLHLTLLFCLFSTAQPPNNGFYLDAAESDYFKIPNSDYINDTAVNNRTYETYFYVNDTSNRQMIFMEGNDKREIIAYIEGGYLIVGAHNTDDDYLPVWGGTFFRKAISSQTWYHVALVFDNAQVPVTDPISATDNTALKWYLNGVLQDEKSGFQIGGNGNHSELLIGYKNQKLWFPTCSSWSSSGLSEYCFQQTINEDGGGENYFDGYIWGFRVWNDVRTATEINYNKDNYIEMGTADLLAALDGDTVTYIDDNLEEQEVDNANPSVVREWEGNQSSDWSDPLNWKNSLVPDDAKQEGVFIKKSCTYYPEINITVVAGDLELENETSKINILSGGLLDLAYDVINDGSITVEDGGSIYIRESTPITGTGTFSVKRASPSYLQPDLYSIWSTPVAETDSQLNTIFLHDIKTYKYDSSQNPSAYVEVGSNETMEVGRGYFIKPQNVSGSLEMTFTGKLNNGNINEPVYFNSSEDNFNLIGNPYPSSISWLKFQKDNTSILDGTMYYWNHTQTAPNSASDYISFNQTGSNPPGSSGIIASGQGFFVGAKQNGTVTFKNNHKVFESNTQFYSIENNTQFINSNTSDQSIANNAAEGPNSGRSWIRLTGGDEFSSTLIGFLAGASDAYDSAYDGELVDEGPQLALYSLIDSGKYVIQGRSELVSGTGTTINLGFEVKTAGTYSISIDQEFIDSNFDIILDDLELDVQTDLRLTDYTFNMQGAAENNGRFVLHYSPKETLGLGEATISKKEIKVYFESDRLITILKTQNVPGYITVHDIKGNLKLSQYFEEKIITSNLYSGLYLVTYDFKNGQSLIKKVIKK